MESELEKVAWFQYFALLLIKQKTKLCKQQNLEKNWRIRIFWRFRCREQVIGVPNNSILIYILDNVIWREKVLFHTWTGTVKENSVLVDDINDGSDFTLMGTVLEHGDTANLNKSFERLKRGKKIVKTRKANKFIKILFVKVSRIKSKRSWQIKSRKVTFLHLSMDFVRSNFGANEPLPVEHFFPHFLAGCCVCAKWGKKFISTELTSYQPLFFVRLPSCRQSKGSGICSCKKPMLFTKIVDF